MFFSLAAALAFPAAPLPSYQPNDAFIFSDGRVERVVRTSGNTVVWRGLRGKPYTKDRNFIVPILAWSSGRGSGKREVRGEPQALWPADRPGSARFRVITETRRDPQKPWRRSVNFWSCKTKKAGTVTVTAGSYRAIPFICDRYSSTSMRLLERLEWQYAPEIGHYVQRSTIDYIRGTRRTIELAAMIIGPAATKPRLTALAKAARDGTLPPQ
jgi:hypothetical protein